MEAINDRGELYEASEYRCPTLHHRCSACSPLTTRISGSICSDAAADTPLLWRLEQCAQSERWYEYQLPQWSCRHLHPECLVGWSIRQRPWRPHTRGTLEWHAMERGCQSQRQWQLLRGAFRRSCHRCQQHLGGWRLLHPLEYSANTDRILERQELEHRTQSQLTRGLTERSSGDCFRQRLGRGLCCWHSGYSDAHRTLEWQ